MTIYDLADEFKNKLDSNDAELAARLIQGYAAVQTRIQAAALAVVKKIEKAKADGTPVSPAWLFQQERHQNLLRLVSAELLRFAEFAEPNIKAEFERALKLAEQHVAALTARQLPGGTTESLAAVGLSWKSFDRRAVESQIAFLTPGGPLKTLLESIAPTAHHAVSQTLVNAVTFGWNPKKTAAQVSKASGIGLVRSLRIARTETMRAYREAHHRSYQDNADIMAGWRWNASISVRTCPVCFALHGKVFPVSERMHSHVNCRCTQVPVVKSWQELGFKGIGEGVPPPVNGEDAFKTLPAEHQRRILGAGKYAAFRAGRISLQNLVGYKIHPTWGPQRFERSLKDALSGVQTEAFPPFSLPPKPYINPRPPLPTIASPPRPSPISALAPKTTLALADLDIRHDDLRALDLHGAGMPWETPTTPAKAAYGGVLIDDKGRVALRKPKGNYDGYHWTFAKGRAQPGDHPADAALREVAEETGHHGQILGLIPGAFKGGTSDNFYFLMRSVGFDAGLMGDETEEVVWVSQKKARELIEQTTNVAGRARDLAVLDSVTKTLKARYKEVKTQRGLSANRQPKPKTVRPPKPTPIPPPPPSNNKTDDFPSEPDSLRVIRQLGGSTGAELVEDQATGRRYVRKRGSNPEHLEEEFTADQAYSALGVAVPRSRLYRTPNGPVKLAEFIVGESLADVLNAGGVRADKISRKIQDHFAADALLGNWDVVGMSYDNILVTPTDEVFRIDNGGSLRFRAQGARKNTLGIDKATGKTIEFDEYPLDLWTLRDAAPNVQTHRIFGNLSIYQIARQIPALKRREKELVAVLPKELRDIVKRRLARLVETAEIARTFESDKWLAGHADGMTRHLQGLDRHGSTERLPKRMVNDPGDPYDVRDEHGKKWDHFRGKRSIITDVAEYMQRNGTDIFLWSEWADAQGGSSYSRSALAAKEFWIQQRAQSRGAYWIRYEQQQIAEFEAVYKPRFEEYRKVWQIMQAFTYRMLQRTSFRFNSKKRRAVRLIRTESKEVMHLNGIQHGTGRKMLRGPHESSSVFKPVHPFGSEVTVQWVPWHRITSCYFFEREPGSSASPFLGDGENEFLYLPEGIPFDYLGAYVKPGLDDPIE